MKTALVGLILLAACASQPPSPVFAPVTVDVPLPVMCRMPPIDARREFMKNLPPDATLTQFTKACAEQTLFDKAALDQFEAALKSCADPTFNNNKEQQ